MGLGANIKKKREDAGLSQKALAELTGFFSQTVGRWEREEQTPNALDLKKIALALNTTTTALLEEVEEEAGKPQSQAAQDFEIMIRDLAQKNPDLAVLFRDTRENWDEFSDRELQAIADGLAFVFGKTTAEQEKRMKKEGRFGRL